MSSHSWTVCEPYTECRQPILFLQLHQQDRDVIQPGNGLWHSRREMVRVVGDFRFRYKR